MQTIGDFDRASSGLTSNAISNLNGVILNCFLDTAAIDVPPSESDGFG